MNNSILKAFAKNGLEILQWSILLLLYEKDRLMKQEEISECLNLPTSTSNSKHAEGASEYALVREILKSVQTKGKYVEWFKGGKWQITAEGRKFVESGFDS